MMLKTMIAETCMITRFTPNKLYVGTFARGDTMIKRTSILTVMPSIVSISYITCHAISASTTYGDI